VRLNPASTHEILLIFPYAGSTSECPGELVFISSQFVSLLEDTFFSVPQFVIKLEPGISNCKQTLSIDEL